MFDEVLNLFNSFFEKPFKVALISYYYPFQKPSTSGVGIHAYNLVTHLAKLGCEIHVFTNGKEDSKHNVHIEKGKIILHFLKSDFDFEVGDSVIQKRIRYAVFESKVLNEFLYENTRRRFDVIHTHGWLTSSAFMQKYLNNIPWVHTVHALERNRLSSMTEEEKKLFKVTSWIEDTLADADKLIAVSESVKKEVLNTFKGSSKRTVVIPNGVDLKLFNPSKNKSLNVLTVSRFSKEKGVDMLPEIIEGVLNANKKYTFTAILQETQIPTLKLVQDKFIELQKKYLGRFIWISRPLNVIELAKYYQNSNIYVQPSLYESFGLCILEAMACKNAIVATNVGGIPEVVGNSGILVEPKAKKITNEIIKLMRSPNLIKKYGSLAAERAKMFDWPIIAKSTLKIYKELSDKKSH
ncbi:MAG: glycosyltransferase family 4 protein [archaeon]|nr:glycosyltransferase family 4 protein [archaeon]